MKGGGPFLGAVWDFSPVAEIGSLAPDAFTKERKLVFELPAIRGVGRGHTFSQGLPWPMGLLQVEAEVLGGAKSIAGGKPTSLGGN